jgi:RNA polymerase sigma-70 factor (ECF subfamily)
LREAIGALPEKQRDALLLKLDGGLDLQSIADVLGVNRETAKSRLRYAVAKLKQALTESAP